jgi:carbamoyl-phosphate synthase large subunit
VINTPEGWQTVMDSKSIRLVANELKVPTYTTIAAAKAAAEALELVKNGRYLSVRALQDYLKQLR